jgi:hypothetical protein
MQDLISAALGAVRPCHAGLAGAAGDDLFE